MGYIISAVKHLQIFCLHGVYRIIYYQYRCIIFYMQKVSFKIYFSFQQSDGSESEMGLALNRYIGNSILPALISHSSFYSEAEQHAPLLDATLHTVYRLSKCKVSRRGNKDTKEKIDFLT